MFVSVLGSIVFLDLETLFPFVLGLVLDSLFHARPDLRLSSRVGTYRHDTGDDVAVRARINATPAQHACSQTTHLIGKQAVGSSSPVALFSFPDDAFWVASANKRSGSAFVFGCSPSAKAHCLPTGLK